MSGLRRTSKNAAMLLCGTMLRMISTFAFIVLVANYLGVEGFGKYALVVHYYELFISLTAMGAGILLTRDIARWPQRRDSLFSSAAALVTAFGLLSPLVLIGLAIGFGYSADTTTALWIACLGLVPAALGVLYEAVFVAMERAEFVTIGSVCESVIRVAAGTVVLLAGGGIIELAWVMIASRCLMLGLYYGLLRQICDHRWDFHLGMTRRFVLRWRVFAAENWMATIYTSLDVIVLSAVVGAAAVGLYSAAWRYVRLGAVVAKSFTTAVFPLLTRAYLESKPQFCQIMQHTFRGMCLVAMPVIAGVTVLPTRVVGLIYKPEYEAAGPILQVLIWVLVLEFLNPFFSHILFSQGKQRLSLIVAALGLVANVVLMLMLVPLLGAVGAAWACVGSGAVATIGYLYFTRELGLIAGLVTEMARVALAAAGLGLVLSQVAEQSWPVIFLVAIVAYTVLLFVVQAVRWDDVRFIRQQLFQRAYAS